MNQTTRFLLFLLFPFLAHSSSGWEENAHAADSLRRAERYTESIVLYERALAEMNQTDQANRQKFQIRIGLSYMMSAQYGLARSSFNQVIHAQLERDTNIYAAHAYNNLGLLNDLEGHYPESISFYSKALSTYEQLGNQFMPSLVSMNIGVIYRKQGKYKEALQSILKATSAFEENGDYGRLAEAYNSLGIVQDLLGAKNKAKLYYAQSIDLYKELDNSIGLSSSYNNMGIIYMDQEILDSAIVYFDKAALLMSEFSQGNLGMVYHNLGISYQKKTDFDKASFYFQKSLAEKKKIANASEILQTLNELIRVALDESNLNNAHVYLSEGRGLISEEVTGVVVKDHYDLWKDYFKNNGEPDSALFYLEASQVFLREMQEREYLEELAFLQESFEAEDRNKQIGKLGVENAGKTQELNKANKTIRYGYGVISVAALGILILLLVLYIRKQRETKRELKAKIQGIESEKNRLAQELHDIVGARLMKLRNGLRAYEDQNTSAETREIVQDVGEHLKKVSSLIRNISHELKLPDFLRGSFSVIISDTLIDWFENSDVYYDQILENEEALNRLSIDEKIIVYRYLLESLNNIDKHTKASEVVIHSHVKEGNLVLEVSDNDQKSSRVSKPGIGQRNLRESARIVGGMYAFNQRATGSVSRMQIPLKA